MRPYIIVPCDYRRAQAHSSNDAGGRVAAHHQTDGGQRQCLRLFAASRRKRQWDWTPVEVAGRTGLCRTDHHSSASGLRSERRAPDLELKAEAHVGGWPMYRRPFVCPRRRQVAPEAGWLWPPRCFRLKPGRHVVPPPQQLGRGDNHTSWLAMPSAICRRLRDVQRGRQRCAHYVVAQRQNWSGGARGRSK